LPYDLPVSENDPSAIEGIFLDDAVKKAAAIRVERLSKVYTSRDGTRIDALQDVSFTVERGKFVALLGHSGCGKSTLLNILASLLPKSGGTVLLDEREIEGPRSDIGIVFQKPLLLEWRRVLENVLLPVEIHRLNHAEFEPKARKLLNTVGLKGFITRYPHELSGGMQQRVAICRALITEPSLLLMDEPFGSLDALNRQKMGLELLRLWDEWKSTVLFVTHDIDEAVMLADQVLVMSPRPGRIIDVVSVELPRPRHIFLKDTPAFMKLTGRIRRRLWENGSDD
jgi:NitT/TauT family transport system ATP-binding protein